MDVTLPKPTTRKLVVAIVSHTEDYAIGYKSHLAVANKLDMKVFKTLTTGHAVVMGANTLRSLPKPSGLPNRQNHVFLPKGRALELGGSETVERVGSVHDLIDVELGETDSNSILWVIGGAATYSILLEHCDYVLACVNDVRFDHHDLIRWDYSFRSKFTKDLLEVATTQDHTVKAMHLEMPTHRQPFEHDCKHVGPFDTTFRYKLYFNANNRPTARKRNRVFEEATVRQIQELLD